MLALKFLLMILGVGFFGSAAFLVAYDVYVAARLRSLLSNDRDEAGTEAITQMTPRPFGPVRSKRASLVVLAAAVPVPLALSIAVVPDGSAAIRVSDFSDVRTRSCHASHKRSRKWPLPLPRTSAKPLWVTRFATLEEKP